MARQKWPYDTPQELVTDLGETIARRYQTINDRLEEKIRTLVGRGTSTETVVQLETRLRLVDELREYTLKQLEQVDPAVIAEWVTSQASAGGAASISRILAEVPALKSYKDIYGTNISAAGLQAVTAIEIDIRNTYTALNSRILRNTQDIYQEITSEYASLVVSGVETRRALRREILNKYLEHGVGAYVDAVGRNWPVDVYAEMATRTAASRAWREQSIISMEASGFELLTPVGGRTACEICDRWQGRVISRTVRGGTSVEISNVRTGELVTVRVDGSLEEMRADGWGHPNCRCVFIPYAPGSGIEPSDFTTRDPEAEADRAEERMLRRELRRADTREERREIRRNLREVRSRIDARKTTYATRPRRKTS